MLGALRAGTAIAAALVAWCAVPHDARACGGCFHGPPTPAEVPTVVTDHRMILTIGQQESTLWDQIEYSGEPSSFAWVLPIKGTVRTGLSANSLFTNLDQLTARTIFPTGTGCPQPPTPEPSACACSSVADAQSAIGGVGFDSGVDVTERAVVGPYETVQLKASDANALETWLAKNGFVIPQDVKPVVDAYVAEKFDFLALRLLPDKSVKDMRPVRVTTPGANVVLPLRMVAAGTGPTVGITLWVLGDGRYEPQNFPSFRILDDELVWDWGQGRSNYTELRAAKTQAAGGRGWEIEASTASMVGALSRSIGTGVNGDYDADPSTGKSASVVHDEDLAALVAEEPFGTLRITRMRADLSHAALAADLVMTASADQSEISSERVVSKDSGQPLCAAYSGQTYLGMLPRDQARAYADRSSAHERFSCGTARGTRSSLWVGGVMAVIAAAVLRRRGRSRVVRPRRHR